MNKDKVIMGGLVTVTLAALVYNVKLRIDSAYVKGCNDTLDKMTKDLESLTEQAEQILETK